MAMPSDAEAPQGRSTFRLVLPFVIVALAAAVIIGVWSLPPSPIDTLPRVLTTLIAVLLTTLLLCFWLLFFSGWRLWNFALEGITSFSTVPLRWWTYFGSAISLFAFIYGLVIIFKTLIHGIDMPGSASILQVVLFLGGIQLIGIGVLGEYMGRTYLESKGRPIYLIRRRYQKTED